jgi:hypothetical protein
MTTQHSASVEKIMRLVANLPDNCVEDVFQGIGRMPQITSVALHHMANVLTDIFQESREAVSSQRTSKKDASKQPSSTARRKRASKKDVSESEPEDEETEAEFVPEEEAASSEEDEASSDSYVDEEGLGEPAKKAPSKRKVRKMGKVGVTCDSEMGKVGSTCDSEMRALKKDIKIFKMLHQILELSVAIRQKAIQLQEEC